MIHAAYFFLGIAVAFLWVGISVGFVAPSFGFPVPNGNPPPLSMIVQAAVALLIAMGLIFYGHRT